MEQISIADMNNMSDEEFDKLNPEDFSFANEEPEDTASADVNDNDDASADDDQDDPEDDADNADDAGDSGEGDKTSDTDDDLEGNDEDDEAKAATVKTVEDESKAKGKAKEEKQEPEQVADVQAKEDFYSKVTTSFKANGKDYTITSPEEVVSLMQKGLNYNAKMLAIKPFMQAGRILEEHALLEDPEQLAFLIDLHNKKPEAIAKLIKESGIDAYELGEEKANEYVPTAVNIPSDNVVRLQEVVATNKDNPDFVAVYNEVTQWDEHSQKLLVDNPDILETLRDHKANGTYDAIMQKVNHLVDVRGNKTPVANLYYQVGQEMFGQSENNKAQAVSQQTASPDKITKRVDPKLAEKRKNLGGVKSGIKTSAKTVRSAEDIFNLSDEEFDELDVSKL